MENTAFNGPHSISLRPFYLANRMGGLDIHQQSSKSSAKRETLFEKCYNQLSVGALHDGAIRGGCASQYENRKVFRRHFTQFHPTRRMCYTRTYRALYPGLFSHCGELGVQRL